MNAISTIFPPGLPLVHGPEMTAPLAAWAAERIPHVGEAGFGPCWAVGVVREGRLAAVVVFHDWQRVSATAQVSIAADTSRWASRQVIGAILGAAFDGRMGGPVRKVWSAIPLNNKRALRFNLGIGFTQEGTLREQFAPKVHSVICGMFDREFHARYRS